MNADLQKKKKRKEKDSSEKRSPLLDFNKIPKLTTKRSHISAPSSSSSSSVEASKSCLRFEKSGNLRSNSCKENILPRPISQKPKKIAPSLLQQWQSRKRPTSKTAQRSKLCTDPANPGKNPRSGSKQFAANQEDLKRSGEKPIQRFNVDNSFISSFENRTPIGKLASGSANFAGEIVEDESNSSIVKTPPIEASVSPEIPNGLPSLLAASAATPCYGAGHVLSGVTDKRKCRPRGVLTVGPALDLSSKREKSDGRRRRSNKESFSSMVLNKPRRTSFVPLPAEASMCWLSPPSCGGDGNSKIDLESQFLGCEIDSGLPHTTSLCCEIDSDLDCESHASGKSRIISEISMPSFEKNDDMHLSLNVPETMPSYVWDNSPHSTGTLSSGNVIQTPKSDSSLGRHFGLSWFNVAEHHRRGFEYELDEVTEILQKSSLSPHNEMPTCNVTAMSFKFDNSTSPFGFTGEHQKHRDTAASLLSDCSFGNVSESNMRISWRDGLVSQIFETGELDCCRCLSDEENVCRTNAQIDSNQSFEGSGYYEGNDLVMKSVLKSPEFLEEEPCIYKNGKEKSSPKRPNSCAESIFTDGGGLVSSADSDWTLCCENQLFQV